MASKIVRENTASFHCNCSVNVYDFRVKLDSADDWLAVLNAVKRKIVGKFGLLRIQIGDDVKFSSKICGNNLTTGFMDDFLTMFQIGDLHSYDEVISIEFICV